MSVPLADLKLQYRAMKDEIDRAIFEVIEDTAFILGKYAQEFEREFAAYCTTKHAIGVCSGTSALRVALLSSGIKAGDEVITTPYTFIATVEAITGMGAKPVFVDIQKDTYNMNPRHIEEKITERTKAIIPVHIYGQPCDMDPIVALGRKYSLTVIEDAAQAHGAYYNSRRVGSLGDCACFSFYPGKNLGAYGDAGGITTDSDNLAQEARLWRDHGRSSKYFHQREGFNFRLDGIQANILKAKLAYLEEWNRRRGENAARYNRLLADIDEVTTPFVAPQATHVYHLYVIKVSDRDALFDHLRAHGVGVGVHYPVPLHLQEAYTHLGLGEGAFPVAEECAQSVLSLPVFPELTQEQIEYVVQCIKDFYTKG
ncbi:MAG: DegT/DnrJ/EryC1/StrS family aminotransferase [Candidatus Omnitrophica bacterium]|nr:DegT/DnrJ/EryC1/StrS family aminotransferase [Candidatus Omnitrophota bacterium]